MEKMDVGTFGELGQGRKSNVKMKGSFLSRKQAFKAFIRIHFPDRRKIRSFTLKSSRAMIQIRSSRPGAVHVILEFALRRVTAEHR
jgi:hypothetical protein